MEMNVLTLAFRTLSILGGILIGLFAYEIFRLTRGGLRGWLYTALYGGFLGFWAITALVTKLVGITVLEQITGIIGLLGMAVFVPLAYAKMTDELDFGPKWFTAKVSVAMCAVVFLTLLGLNVTEPSSVAEWLGKLLSISHASIGITLLFALIPLSSLAFKIRRPSWVIALIAIALLSVSMLVGQHYVGCCGGPLSEDTQLCGQYDLPYGEVLGTSCLTPLVMVGQFYQAYLAVGFLLLAISFYRLAKGFRGFEKNA